MSLRRWVASAAGVVVLGGVVGCRESESRVRRTACALDSVTSLSTKTESGTAPHIDSVDGDPIRGMAAADSFIVVGRDYHGHVQRFSRSDGHLQWQWNAPNLVHNDPLLAGSTVIATWGDSRPMTSGQEMMLGGGPGGIAALDAATGRPLWTNAVAGSAMTSAVAFGDTVYVATGNRILYGFDRMSGHEYFHMALPGISAMANPRRLEDSLLLVGLSMPSSMQLVNLATRRPVWTTPITEIEAGINDVDPVVVHGLIVSTGTQALSNSRLLMPDGWSVGWRKVVGRMRRQPPLPKPTRQWVVALDACDGHVAWQRSAGVGLHVESNRSGTPATDGALVYVASSVLQAVVAYDFAGRMHWSTPIPGLAKGSVVVTPSGLYAVRTDGSALSLDTATGRATAAAWRTGHPMRFVMPHQFQDGVTVMTDDGRLASLRVDPRN